jgi:tape measure domain-containing protein
MSQKISVELELIDNISRNWDAVMSRLAKGTNAVQSEARQLSSAARVTETSLRAEAQAAVNLNPILRQTENISGLLSAQLQQLTAHANQNAVGLRSVSSSVDKLAESMKRSNEEKEKSNRNSTGLGASLGTLRAAYASVAAIVGGVFVSSLLDAGLAAERVQRTLKFAEGGAYAGREAFAFLRREASALGFNLQASAAGFGKLTAAAYGTTLQGRVTRDIFIGISQASVALGLSADQAEGALNAIQQMISKGTVQAEELRGQLGERLPGAFQMAARAMGVSTAELGKMLERGDVMAEDLLPKLAKELQATFGQAAVDASEEGQAALNRFGNEVRSIAAEVGGGLVTALGKAAGLMLRLGESAEMTEKRRALARAWSEEEKKRLKKEIEDLEERERQFRATFGKDKFITEAEQKKSAELAKQKAIMEEVAKLQEQERMKTAGPTAAQSKVIEEMAKEEKKAREKAEKDAKAAAERQKQLTIEARRALQDAEVAAIEDQNLREIAAMELKYARLFEEAKGNKEAERALNQAFDLEAETQAREHAEKLSKARLQAVVKARKEEEDALKQESADRRKQEKEDADSLNRRYAATQTFFGGMSQLMIAAAGKNKQLAAAAKAVAIGEAVANTYVAANKALASAPPPFNFIAMAGVIAAGLANVIKIQSAKGFREGGYTGEGSPGDVAGVVHKKEFVFDAAATSRIGRGNLEAMRRGLPAASSSSRTTIYAPFAPVIQGPTPQETVDRMTTSYFDKLREFRRMQRDVVDYDVPEMA